MYFWNTFWSEVPWDIFSSVMKAGLGGNAVIWRSISSSLYSGLFSFCNNLSGGEWRARSSRADSKHFVIVATISYYWFFFKKERLSKHSKHFSWRMKMLHNFLRLTLPFLPHYSWILSLFDAVKGVIECRKWLGLFGLSLIQKWLKPKGFEVFKERNRQKEYG